MSTRAEEIAAEGPYKVIQLTDRLVPTFVLTGPHHVAAFWATRHDAKTEADRLNAAYNHGQQDRWISVEDRMPEDGVWVLIFSAGVTDDLQWDIGYWDVSGKWKCIGWDYPVTHWMPLPSPPNS